ncbi:FAD-binding protein, partial [Desulfosarcina sp. OttesenSCG-928-G17]|nr:FAD-binding protein [Desulfosarcina sp. OttesenSCG-928-G17]
FATVFPHGMPVEKKYAKAGETTRITISDSPVDPRIRLVSSHLVPVSDEDLESAKTVVVGGAGLGTSANFAKVRELAAALSGQVAATRPPVLDHWVEEDRLIGQTGKTIRPELLISVATSGAVQYTAGIMDAGTIVAINRDPSAPIFSIADLGIVADAPTFLPLLSERIRKTVMRKLADAVCAEAAGPSSTRRVGEKISALRKANGWSVEKIAEVTGQTPEFITGVESGEISPPVAFFLRLSTAYGVDPGVFLQERRERQTKQPGPGWIRPVGRIFPAPSG